MDSVWITDDEAAYEYGKQVGLLAWDTTTVLEHLVSDGTLNTKGAFDVLREMVAADRTPRRIPSKPSDLG